MGVDKKLMRTNTEYIGMAAQQNNLAKLGALYGDTKQKFKEQEAQGLASVFRGRVETECGERFEDWTVTKFHGDCHTAMLAKVQTRQDYGLDSEFPVKASYLHLWVERRGKSKQWDCAIALSKSVEDLLDEDDLAFEELEDEEPLCVLESCVVM